MPPIIPDSERFRLLSLWCDGVMSDTELERLDALLESDAEFRKAYLAYVDQHAVIFSDALALGLPHLPPADIGMSEVGAWAAVEPVSGRACNSWQCRFRTIGLAMLSAAAVLLAYMGIVSMRPSAGPEVQVRAEHSPATGSEGGLAVVVKVDGLSWEKGEGPRLWEGKVLSPGRLQFRAGCAVVSFFSGVTLAVVGPADVNLVSMNRVFCRLGKLRARVPEGAEGFVIATRESAVVDLGTEFALNVTADGKAQVMVFEGKAEAALLDERGCPTHTQLVEQNKAFDLDPRANRIEKAALWPAGFAPELKLVDPYLALDPLYPTAVLQSRPMSYWRFESMVDGAIPNDVAGGPPLRVNGSVQISERRGGNRCAVFKAGDPTQFLSTDILWDLSRDPGHALEFWFLSERYEHVSLVGLFPPGSPGRYVHTFFVELTAQERQSLNKPASVRFLHRWPLDLKVGNNLFTDRIYLAQHWHHVVAQKDGNRMDLYFDGVREQSMRLDPDHPKISCRLVVGRRTPDAADFRDIRPFVGRLDELAIYDRPLSAEEVWGHFQLAKRKVEPGSP